MRFWSFQILFIAVPAIFYYMFAGSQLNYVKLLEEAEKKRRDAEDKRTKLKYMIAKYETEESEIGGGGGLGGSGRASGSGSARGSEVLEKRTD